MPRDIAAQLGCSAPIFAFSHCRDVVMEASRSGGFGVLGAVLFSPEQLEQELRWIDAHVGDHGYGVDVLIPVTYSKEAETSTGRLREIVPSAHLEFVGKLLDDAGIPPLPPAVQQQVDEDRQGAERNNTPAGARALIAVALRHPKMKLLVSALGSPPPDVVQAMHARGGLVGALCGKAEHARRHAQAGVDVVIAQGTEAGGHTGAISTFVLVPQVVQACGPDVAVLAAGGITRGSQVAAAIAMGAQGVWCGTLWLATRESDLLPYQKQALFKARAEDAVQSLSRTGKPVRLLRSRWSEAWEAPGAPRPLPPPLQEVLVRMAVPRIDRAQREDFYTTPCGQGVADLQEELSVRQVMIALQEGYLEALERLAGLHARLLGDE